MTPNLLLKGGPDVSRVDPDPELTGELAGDVEKHFATPDAPDRLVYLPGHEYTSRGLDWSPLKAAEGGRRGRCQLGPVAPSCRCFNNVGSVGVPIPDQSSFRSAGSRHARQYRRMTEHAATAVVRVQATFPQNLRVGSWSQSVRLEGARCQKMDLRTVL